MFKSPHFFQAASSDVDLFCYGSICVKGAFNSKNGARGYAGNFKSTYRKMLGVQNADLLAIAIVVSNESYFLVSKELIDDYNLRLEQSQSFTAAYRFEGKKYTYQAASEEQKNTMSNVLELYYGTINTIPPRIRKVLAQLKTDLNIKVSPTKPAELFHNPMSVLSYSSVAPVVSEMPVVAPPQLLSPFICRTIRQLDEAYAGWRQRRQQIINAAARDDGAAYSRSFAFNKKS